MSEPTLDREPAVADGNGSHWVHELQAWRGRQRQRLPRRRLVVFGAAAVVLLAAVAYGVHWWHWSGTHVSTDDAFIAGHIAPVSARVPGTVLEVLVNDNQDVKAGDVLVRLDSRDYDVALVLARAAAEAARGDLQNATANIPLTDESTRSLLQEADASLAAIGHAREGSEHDLEQKRGDLAARQSAVEAARAAQQAAQSDFDRARLDRERTVELYRRELVARQDLDHTEAAVTGVGFPVPFGVPALASCVIPSPLRPSALLTVGLPGHLGPDLLTVTESTVPAYMGPPATKVL